MDSSPSMKGRLMTKLARFQGYHVQIQLDSILYLLQGSALTCMVHQMVNLDDETIARGLDEFYRHGSLSERDVDALLEIAEDLSPEIQEFIDRRS